MYTHACIIIIMDLVLKNATYRQVSIPHLPSTDARLKLTAQEALHDLERT